MNCPACQQMMVEEDFGGVKVDVCKDGCKGIWFDWLELIKLDEKHEGMGQALQEALNSERHKDEGRGQLNCPKCNIPMFAHLYGHAKLVTVDECYNCSGFYLDSGELELIRENFMTEKERDEFVNAVLTNIPEYNNAVAKLAEDKKKVNPNAGKRAEAIGKFANALMNKFGR